MERIPEPELMNEAEQARAYAWADFDAPHQFFIDCFRQRFTNPTLHGNVLDLGCGPADISVRFARAYPHCHIDGVDGAEAMLREGHQRLKQEQLTERIHLYQARLPRDTIPQPAYDVIISNSLLHHLHEPQVLWQAVKQHGRPGTPVFVMDLQRPASAREARELMEHYAAGEPPILQHDFYQSLCAAFTPEEVRQQLHQAGLDYLEVNSVSDRHLVVQGHLGE
ncbi:class I SAM-dependent methyltransferase [Thiohalophilus thiocyanatoxydans]|uniref:Methyltransferase family protein n=1 Tax=Thiohalophilus thiocyanatoxydans TaxID=381308 RepID=A0A4R8IWU0_9GAMM|nr:class I SAM-dependent methyltransferase [Thiohalophilus thiocyanatoxydans]TDY03980.1 methyltransferase family protein [Thiohalophilus thiocyanatoxydans]